MSIGGKIRFIGWWLRDRLNNPRDERVYAQWADIRETLADYKTGWPRVQRALQRQLDHATANSPFYKKYAGKPLAEFPVVNKMILQQHRDEITVSDVPVAHISRTSGSTGTPFWVAQNQGKRNRLISELKYFGDIVGYKSHERAAYFRSNPHVSWWNQFWTNVWLVDASNLSPANIQKLLKRQSRAQELLAASSMLDVIVQYCTDNNIRGSDSVRAIIAGGTALLPGTKQMCRHIWRNATVVDRYADMEMGILGQNSHRDGNENFMLNWASYYFEILKMDSDEPAAPGEVGRIVITDMYNRAFPMIRYDTGDLGMISKPRGKFPYLSQLAGRRVDMVYGTNRTPITAHTLTRLLYDMRHVLQWQFIQDSRTKYRILYCAKDTKLGADEIATKIIALKQIFGTDAKIEPQAVNEIPVLSSGKRKLVVQNWRGHP